MGVLDAHALNSLLTVSHGRLVSNTTPSRPAGRRIHSQQLLVRLDPGLSLRKQPFALPPRERGELDPPGMIVDSEAADRNLAIEIGFDGGAISIGLLGELMQCFGWFELAASAAGEHEMIVEDH